MCLVKDFGPEDNKWCRRVANVQRCISKQLNIPQLKLYVITKQLSTFQGLVYIDDPKRAP